MAYTNNQKHYIWRGGGETEDHLHITFKETDINIEIPMSLFDELVAMRHAQLVDNLRLQKVQRRAWKKYNGSLDCDALAKLLGKPTVASLIENHIKGGMKKKHA